jgi:hypothetical protein
MAPLPRSWLFVVFASLLAVACGTAKPAASTVPAATTLPAARVPSAQPPIEELYAADEAIRDALSGRWEYLGTGPWPGNNRVQACAFRNERVIVVNAFCTLTETQAFRIDVYSPERGRVRIYAEANGPISSFMRQQYFTFKAESEPPSASAPSLPTLVLGMSFDQLSAYEQQRYNAFLPGCYGGLELSRKRDGCLGKYASNAGAWADRNNPFLERANSDWYRLVREMRALAARHGKEPD